LPSGFGGEGEVVGGAVGRGGGTTEYGQSPVLVLRRRRITDQPTNESILSTRANVKVQFMA